MLNALKQITKLKSAVVAVKTQMISQVHKKESLNTPR